MGAHLVIVLVMSASAYGIASWVGDDSSDIKILNGHVLSKKYEKVSCGHSYSCNCRSVSCGKNCTSTVCDTCYEHSFDIDWVIKSSVGDFNINRVDRQGLKEPNRWSVANKFDPVSRTTSYKNFVKGVPHSIYSNYSDSEDFPQYPAKTHDYYHVNRTVSHGAKIPDIAEWNKQIESISPRLGSSLNANAVIIFTDKSRQYAYDIEKNWLNGKFNDVLVVIGTKNYPKTDWVKVLTWSKVGLVRIAIEDALMDKKISPKLDPLKTTKLIEGIMIANYQERDPMDFDYLEDEIKPPNWLIILFSLIGMIGSVALAYYFGNNDLDDKFALRAKQK